MALYLLRTAVQGNPNGDRIVSMNMIPPVVMLSVVHEHVKTASPRPRVCVLHIKRFLATHRHLAMVVKRK